MRRKGGQKLPEGRGNWLTSGSPIRATIRHELHSHAHLHTRPYINIRSGRETGSALHTGPPARVISSFVGIPVGHQRSADPEKGVAHKIHPADYRPIFVRADELTKESNPASARFQNHNAK